MSRKHNTKITGLEIVKEAGLLPELREPQVLTAMLEKERQHRSDECLKEIQAALARWNCRLQAQPGITPQGTVTARVLVVPLDAPAAPDFDQIQPLAK